MANRRTDGQLRGSARVVVIAALAITLAGCSNDAKSDGASSSSTRKPAISGEDVSRLSRVCTALEAESVPPLDYWLKQALEIETLTEGKSGLSSKTLLTDKRIPKTLKDPAAQFAKAVKDYNALAPDLDSEKVPLPPDGTVDALVKQVDKTVKAAGKRATLDTAAAVATFGWVAMDSHLQRTNALVAAKVNPTKPETVEVAAALLKAAWRTPECSELATTWSPSAARAIVRKRRFGFNPVNFGSLLMGAPTNPRYKDATFFGFEPGAPTHDQLALRDAGSLPAIMTAITAVTGASPISTPTWLTAADGDIKCTAAAGEKVPANVLRVSYGWLVLYGQPASNGGLAPPDATQTNLLAFQFAKVIPPEIVAAFPDFHVPKTDAQRVGTDDQWPTCTEP